MSATTPLIAVGASAGGPAAVGAILGALPVSVPAAIVVVQHIDQTFAPGLVSWLAQHTSMPVRLAADRDEPQPGEVLLAGGPLHLVLSSGGLVRYRTAPHHTHYHPSIDVFFHSVAKHAREAIGVLLTGMGRDGASGLKAMRQAGALTIVQDRATSAIYGMPKAAVALDGGHTVLALHEIARRLTSALASSDCRSPRSG